MVDRSPTAAAPATADERRRLLQKLLRKKAETARTFPLSFAQERLWLLDQLAPGNPVYNIPLALRVRGPLDAQAFDRTLTEIAARHETLRTSIQASDAGPLQRILPPTPQAATLIDLQDLDVELREEEALRRAVEEAKRPFRLEDAPLFRAVLVRLTPEEHVLVFVMHHIISDGWSMGILFRELTALYAAFSSGEAPTLPPLSIQYADYSVWQRGHWQGERLERQLNYWTEQLRDLPSLELPTDRARPLQSSFAGARECRRLPQSVSDALRQLARSERATLFMTLLAAFEVLMHRYTGQEDFGVGTPIAGRPQQEVEGLIGLFLNTLVLRADLSGNPTFRELVGRVRDKSVEAFQHQDVPFERLVEAVNPTREAGRNPLFQVFFNMLNAEPQQFQVGELDFQLLHPWNPSSIFDLTLYIRDRAGCFDLELVYSTDLFTAPRMKLLLEHFEAMVSQFVEHPDAPIDRCSLITPSTTDRLPDPHLPLEAPRHEPVTETIRRIAQQQPDAVAISQADATWSYQELWSAAEQLALQLRARGLAPGEVVGVDGPRSFGLITALVGVQLAGGVMLPLDPALPEDRRRVMLQQAESRLLIAIGASSASISALRAAEGLDILELAPDTARCEPFASPASLGTHTLPEIRPEDPAYVFFTSGSTGQPKGILGSHRGLSHFLHWQRTRFEIGAGDRVAQLTALSFDVVLRDIFLPLTSGATLCLPERDDLSASGEVLAWLEEQRISVVHTVPSLVRHWLAQAAPGQQYRGVRWVFSAGEPLTDTLVRAWRERFSEGQIVNLYGPTETTLAKCYYIVPEESEPGVQPVGHAIPQSQALVLRANGERCGIGEPGEIVIRTPFRTLGYLHAEERDRLRFVPNPFRDDPADVLYRTGDAGRYRPDGLLEILGRMDDQVKIRGVRIEPSEIAAVLDKHARVRTCAVLAHRDDRGQYFLAAYVVPAQANGSQSVAACERQLEEQLRRDLTARLPAAMVPAAFVFLDSLPLLPNGKVNRRALPKPELTTSEQEYIAPRSGTEKVLADLWAEILGVERVGIRDNFFALGGHSLLAVQLLSRLRAKYDVELPVVALFTEPTLENLARRIDALCGEGESTAAVSIPARDVPSPVPVSFAQEPFLFVSQMGQGLRILNIHRAATWRGPLDVAALRDTLAELVRRHEALRTTFSFDADGQPVQIIAPEIELPFALVDLSGMADEEQQREVQRLSEEWAGVPFDLARGPLFQLRVLRLAAQHHILVVTIHHIVFDGTSLGVLLRDAGEIYAARLAGVPWQTNARSVQYGDYALWEREYLQGDVLQRLLAYWREKLTGITDLELLTDRPRSAQGTRRPERLAFHLSAEWKARLQRLCRAENVTPYMALLAGLQSLLMRYTGAEDIAVGSPVANRSQPETQQMLGLFVNTMVLRSDLSGNPTFRELLARVRETTSGAFEHQALPFSRLVEELRPHRTPGRHPLVQVLFNYQQGAAFEPFNRHPEIDVQPFEVATIPALGLFDLGINLIDQGHQYEGETYYDAEVFDESTIARLVRHLQQLLEAAMANPDLRLSELPLLARDEQQQVVFDWNETQAAYPQQAGIHELFEARVLEQPHKIAVLDGARQWTYAELNERANRLAHRLRALGVGPDSVVAVRLPRSAELMMSLLGVLKAGGAYLPLDPHLPPDRLRYMIADARVDVVVTDRLHEGDLPVGPRHVVRVDADQKLLDAEPAHNPQHIAGDHHLAYVIYTSGSTGEPKGVMVEHRALANYTRAAIDQYAITDDDRILQFASVSFDAFAEEFYTAFSQGATLVLRTDDVLDARQFCRRAAEWGLTFVTLPTAFWHELTSGMVAERLQLPASLRMVVIGGERALPERWAAWLNYVGPHVRVLNTYGPTETTVVATAAELSPRDLQAERLPIGRPLANMTAYVLDQHLQPVPVGVRGELYVGGASVARGYLGDPERTAQRFLADPFSAEPEARMYRTGDLVRWRADGHLEFLGRADDQVKIRGFRVEPGEVERLLDEHPLLAEVVVVVREREPGQPRLAAYAVAQTSPPPTAAALREFLADRLPEYMIPSAFTFLDALPKNTSGKVDRRALPAPAWSDAEQRVEFIEPATDTEIKLAAIWAEILRCERVGAADHFFDLGGNSLLAVRLASRVRSVFELDLPLAALFATPTLRHLAAEIDKQLARRGDSETRAIAIPRRAVQSPVPVSFAQEPFWFVHQLSESMRTINIHRAIVLRGPVDIEALQDTMRELVRRHEALRTTFTTAADGQPMQVIAAERELPLPVEDLRHLPAREREAEVRRISQQSATDPFDLEAGNLFRVRLLQTDDHEHVVIVTVHHIVFDGWSLALLIHQAGEIYAARRAGMPWRATTLPVQYGDYAVWQREHMQGEVLAELLDYWRGKLAGLQDLGLTTDRPRDPSGPRAPQRHRFAFSEDWKARLAQLCRAENITPYMALLAGLQTLLMRYTGSDDIAVGSPVANRGEAEIQDTIGLFVNTVVMRSDLAGNPTFRELLARVRETATEAFDHQSLPFNLLVDELKPERSAGKHPLVQVLLNFQQLATERQLDPRQNVTATELDTDTIPSVGLFDLVFAIDDEDQGYSAETYYDAQVFNEDTIARLVGHFQTLLEAAIANPDLRLSELPLLSSGEHQQVLVAWNETQAHYPQQVTIHELFETQALQQPQKVAVVDGPRQWTYAELNERANRLAHRLRALGVGPDAVVAVRLPRSAELMMALMGVLKAGGAYLPLDPHLPPDRLRYMLADAKVDVVVTDTLRESDLPVGPRHVVRVDADQALLAAESGHNPARTAEPHHLAYVIYTSGSTGEPKGVMIEHRALVNYTRAAIDQYAITADDRILQFASVSFDAFAEEFYTSLTEGATLVLRTEDLLDARQFCQRAAAWELTFVTLPTAFWHELTSGMVAEQLQLPASLRMVIIGGERALPERWATWHRYVGPGVRVLNTYGPTETTVVATAAELTASDTQAERLPIGRPMANMTAYVLDRHLQPVPVGVRGELYVGGASVARGYLGDAERTAERFLADPFRSEPDARMYRTGDLVRWRADGQLEFLGRADDQVKIRGFRVEPGEVERLLDEHPLLAEVVVVVREREPGQPRLAAYAVAHAGAIPSAVELREFLADRLPEYMIPSAFSFLDTLPKNTSGKVDRRALPAPEWSDGEQRVEFIAPATETETKLAAIWSEILRVEQVGATDHFFDLGGNSLLAVRLASRVRNVFELDLPLASLFSTPTLRHLAAQIDSRRQNAPDTRALVIPRREVQSPIPVSFAQEPFWFVHQLSESMRTINVHQAIVLRGTLDMEALRDTIRELVRRHEALRTRFTTSADGQPLQVIAAERELPLPLEDLRHLPTDERAEAVRRLSQQSATAPFDLEAGDLFRVRLLQTADDECVVIVTVHHIVFDGWSLVALVHQAGEIYTARTAGLPWRAETLPVQYGDYAVWQRNHMQGEVLDELLGYWRSKLAGLTDIGLATDHPRDPSGPTQPKRHRFAFSEDWKTRLAQLCRAENITPYMALLAGLKSLLMRYTGSEDIAVGSPSANRGEAEIQDTIGLFVNTLVMRSDLSGNPTFRELLARVRETATEAFDHQSLPFNLLVDELKPERAAGKHPLVQVLLNFRQLAGERQVDPRQLLTVRELDTDTIPSLGLFDLVFNVDDVEEGFHAETYYDGGVFDDETIARLVGHFQTLLEAAVSNPDVHLSELPLLSGTERQQLLVRWNDNAADYPQQAAIHELFETQVLQRPEKVAIIDGDRQWSYAELNERANRLAHHLRGLGVGPDSVVAVRLPRSAELMMALMGVLKAGGAYLPLDPQLPPDRLRYMLADANVNVVVTDDVRARDLPVELRHVVRVDADQALLAAEPTHNVPRAAESHHLAYVIYTSGSTGEPKGVMIEHRALVNYTRAAIDQYAITPEDRILQFASVSFDAFAEEFFTSLTHGATLVLRTDDLLDARQFCQRAAEWELTFVTLPTAFWHELTSGLVAEQLQLPGSLRMVVIGGERALPERWATWHSYVGPRVRVLNTYGPTETTVVATAAELTDQDTHCERLPIGRPMANMRAYVLDSFLQPVPVGVRGELYVGGASVARGYLGDAQRTAERFLVDPFSGDAHGRMYRTGDLVRWRVDGQLEFLGRADDQVKIRGFRVEPGEVERLLDEHSQLAEVVVVVREREPGQPRLAAYAVAHPGNSPTAAELREFLADRLPEYMIPSAFTFLDSLPKNTSGKVERRALPTPAWSDSDHRAEFIPPATDTEIQLATIWSEILRVERVGATDHFFDLGGNSLLAVRLASRVRNVFELDLPLAALFTTPTLRHLAAQIDAQRQQQMGTRAIAIPRRDVQSPIPVSFAQEPFWFVHQLSEAMRTISIHRALVLRGPVDIEALRDTFRELVRRHEALRTRFTTSADGQPLQVIAPERELPLPLEDLRHLPAQQREAHVHTLSERCATEPFDLEAGDLFRVRLLQTDDDETVVIVTVHHIVFDGWSLVALVHQAGEIYMARAAGLPWRAETLPVQYGDYAVWQRSHMQGEVLEKLLGYWRHKLAGLSDLGLSTDRPRDAAGPNQPRRRAFALSHAWKARLAQLCRSENITPYMALLAGLQTLLMRYTGSDDIAIGSPSANRGEAEIQDTIGLFVNTVVMRSDLGGNPTFRELLARVRETATEAFDHQSLPFNLLVDDLKPERAAGKHPLVQVLLNFRQLVTDEEPNTEQLITVRDLETDTIPSLGLFDLVFTIDDEAQGFSAETYYDARVFDDETIERLVGHFQTLLEGAIANPDQRLSDLPLLSAAEQQRLLSDWNGACADYPQQALIHELFEAQVRTQPQKIAVVDGERTWTYEALNERANRLAHRLRALGVGADSVVAVRLPRSAELMMALMGVLKAGGAYLPLDPHLPPDRLRYMLENAEVEVVVTDSLRESDLPDGLRHVVRVDADQAMLDAEPAHNPARAAESQHLAYVIYTSGSTGEPKGVMIEHQALVNYTLAAIDQYAITGDDRILQFASVSFDAFAEEFYTSLTQGATLILRTEDLLDARQFCRRAAEWELTFVTLPTAFWHELTSGMVAEQLQLPDSLRMVIIGGERALPERWATWRSYVGPHVRVLNTYGPTETTVVATAAELHDDDTHVERLPIGRPLANMRAYVLDNHLQPVPAGVRGELYVGGASVARGYLGDAQRTAERFLTDPFSTEPHARMYRTGDLVRWRADGQLEFLGRADDQVKIRGFRVEPGEVERLLDEHPLLAEVVVVVREREPGEPRLAAYVVAHAGATLTTTELRAFLADRLPDYMIPSAFTFVESLPKNTSGKVERRTLPAPDWSDTTQRVEFVAPQTETEKRLAELWTEVLRVESPGLHDNFFDLGGNSLLAVRLMSAIRRSLRVDLPLGTLFSASTLASLAHQIDNRRATGTLVDAPGIERREVRSPVPVSFAQEPFWFVHQLSADMRILNIHGAVSVRGQLDVQALEDSMQELVRRHESLRTFFAVDADGQPVQIVEDHVEVKLPVQDLRHLSMAERRAEAQRLSRAWAAEPFDLTRCPLFRMRLLQVDDAEHVLVVTIHHIVFDGWSLQILIREGAEIYDARTSGRPWQAPGLPVQYGDYALWQRTYLQGEVLEQLLDYWRNKLAGMAELELPTDHPRPVEGSRTPRACAFQLAPAWRSQLQALCRAEGATPYMVLLAGLQSLLMRYTGAEDVAVGTPVANRGQAETQAMIGLFVNTVVMRSDLSGDPTFRELLARVRETATGAFDHQALPFHRLLDELKPRRVAGKHPLVQVLFNYHQNVAAEQAQRRQELMFGYEDITALPMLGLFDLIFAIVDNDDDLYGEAHYDAQMFDEDSMNQLVRHFQALLEAAVAHPDLRLSELPLLSEGERQQLLMSRNETHADYPRQAVIHELFEEQVLRQPQKIAVIDGERQWTYEELNQQANRLAHRLRSLGVGPDAVVAVRLPRSAELMMALMGALKAGGAYLPLDPYLPPDRLRYMLADAQVNVVVTDRLRQVDLPDGIEHVVCVDADQPLLESDATHNPGRTAESQHLAYVIYTSGSTGEPKGVMIEHRALVNYTRAAIDQYAITAEDRILQFASVSFDAFAEEYYTSLTQGATLILRTDDLLDARQFCQRAAEWNLTFVTLPTAFWHELTSGIVAEQLQLPESLRMLIIGGERALPERWATWRRYVGPRVRVLNTYGPTETTVVATAAELSDNDAHGERLPIGRPLANMRAYVLDTHLQPVPAGVRGELYVGGASVARGYLGDAARTAERFPVDPFRDEPNARMYRTGDLVRWRTDGQLEFLGRADDQVKIRGFRVEPGEVERLLSEHPQLAEVVVMVREREPGQPRLAAYAVAHVDPAPTAADLRYFLADRLPDYMIPSAFTFVDSLPKNTSGKVERRALPTPEWSDSTQRVEYVAPRTDTELQLAELWAEVLQLNSPGVHDNFFELGGNSLLALRLASRVRATFRIDVPLATLFTAPSIEALAARIDELKLAGATIGMPAIQPRSETGPAPLSFTQERFWFLEQVMPGTALQNLHGAVTIEGQLDVPALRATMEELVRRHEILRTRFFTNELGEAQQEAVPLDTFELPVIALDDLDEAAREAEVSRLSVNQAAMPFDLTSGLLFRATLVALGDRKYVLLLTTHHIAFDEWSLQLLLRDVAEIYGAIHTGSPVASAANALQYADYAVWQRQYLRGETLHSLLAYWDQELAGLTDLELPADHPRDAEVRRAADNYFFAIPIADRHQLEQLCRSAGVTPYMILLAAFQTLLHRYSASEDIAIGTPVANRRQAEAQSMIGVFVNTLVLRGDLSGNPTFRELLERVRQSTLAAFEHQELPFERLVEHLQPARVPGRNPLVQILFNYVQNTSAETITGRDELVVGYRATEIAAAPDGFELTLSLSDEGEQLAGEIHYDAGLFERDRITSMADHFQRLLAAALANPDEAIGRLPLLAAEEIEYQCEAWNQTAAEFPEDVSVHELFEAQVARTPDAIAAVFQTCTLTYDELNRRANRVAWWLRSQGVGPDHLVGLHLERSLDMLVGLLGIAKSGAAFVPLDADLPAERLGYMCADAGLQVVVTNAQLADTLRAAAVASDVQPVLLRLDADGEQLESQQDSNPPRIHHARNLAYVIYTSGSTGRPKGVLVEHRSLINVVHSFLTTYQLGPQDRVLQNASISFDVSLNEIFPGLATGAAIVLPDRDERLDLEGLPRFVRQHHVTIIAAAPSLLAQLNELPDPLPGVRLVLSGGEALSLGEVDRLRHAATVVNGYGPTEAAICATCYPLPRDVPATAAKIPIGRPLANYRVYILDRHLNCLPPGCPGELCISGVGLARGYLNAPELTAEKFVPHPFAPGERLYRTGDLARWLPDGNIEFLGRIDHQVKIRGYRIELGEIEAVLAGHPAVQKSAVIDWQVSAGDKRLVAYVVAAPGSKAEAGEGAELLEAELREHTARKLAAYMVPSAFIFLDALPLTSNGKVDRRRLPAPKLARNARTTAYVAPRTAAESQLVSIWRETLQVEEVGIHDNFFDLGGNSLLAVQAMARARQQGGINLPAVALFRSPTIAQLVEQLREGSSVPDTSDSPALALIRELTAPAMRTPSSNGDAKAICLVPLRESTSSAAPLFLVHGLGGHVSSLMPLARELAGDRAIYGLQGLGLEPGQQAHDDLEAMAADYLREIRARQPQGPYLLAGWSLGGMIAVEMAHQLAAAGQHAALVLMLDTHLAVFDDDVEQIDDRAVLRWLAPQLGVTLEELEGLSLESQWERLAQAANLAEGVGVAEIRRLADTCKAHWLAAARYEPKAYHGPAVLLRAKSEREPMEDRWASLCPRLRAEVVPGDHYSMLRKPHVNALADRLRHYLESLESIERPTTGERSL